MGKKLYVGNLTYNVNETDLEALFTPFGTVQSAQIIVDRDTKRSKGFGFVEMDTDDQAQAAIQRGFHEASVARPRGLRGLRVEKEEEDRQWMLRVLQCKEGDATLRSPLTSDDDLRLFLWVLKNGKLKDRNKVLSVLADGRGIPHRVISRFLHISRNTIASCCHAYSVYGCSRLFNRLDRANPGERPLQRGFQEARSGRPSGICAKREEENRHWMLAVLQCKEDDSTLRSLVTNDADLWIFIKTLKNGKLRDKNKVLSVLADRRGISHRVISRFLHISRNTIEEAVSLYRIYGCGRLFKGFSERTSKSDDELLQNTLFSVLHTPPSAYNINRTT